MRIRLLTALVSPTQSCEPGDLYETDEGTAARFIAKGYAVPVSIGGVELAVTPEAPERAVRPRGRRRA